MELSGWKLGILGFLLILGLVLSIASIVTATNCSKSCTSSSNLKTNPVPVAEPSNLGAGDSVGPTGPPGPPGPTLSTSFAIAYGYARFPGSSTTMLSPNFVYGCTITRDPGYWSYTIKFSEFSGTKYSVVANAEAYGAGNQSEKGHLLCSIISDTLQSGSVQIRVYDTGSGGVYTGPTFISFMVSG